MLLLLELFDASEVEYDGILSGDDIFFSVASCCMRRNLSRVCEYFERTIPLYFPDEFKTRKSKMTDSFSNGETNLRAVYSQRHASRKNTTW